MATNNLLSWRAKNHQFDSIPSNVQGHIRQQLRLPPAHEETLLPPQNMSVIDFAFSFRLHPVCKKPTEYIIPDGHCFYSQELHNNDVSILVRLTLPPRTVLAILVKDGKQAWLNGSNSISLPREQACLPMWAPHFWTELLMIEPVHAQWRNALEWLKRKEFQPFQVKIQATIYSLSTLSWSGLLAPLLPGKSAFLKSSLQVFLSRNWLSCDHIDQLAYLLERDLHDRSESANVHLIDTILAQKLLDLNNKEKDDNQIYLLEGHGFWQRFGARLDLTSRVDDADGPLYEENTYNDRCEVKEPSEVL
jgi:hypothetical protein